MKTQSEHATGQAGSHWAAKGIRLLSWIISGCAATSMAVAGAKQVFTDPAVIPANPDAAGKELVARLLSLQPAEGTTNSASFTNYIKRKFQSTMPLRIEVSVTESNWTTAYVQLGVTNHGETRFVLVRNVNRPNEYHVESTTNGVRTSRAYEGSHAMVPIAGSEFTLAEVGMEFLRWPTQRLLKKDMSGGQSCDVLESVAPEGWTNGYVRVVSWFDIDTGGPVLVEAYDADGSKWKCVKEFKPSILKKVNGQWQVEELEMNNWRTGSRSILHFNLEAK